MHSYKYGRKHIYRPEGEQGAAFKACSCPLGWKNAIPLHNVGHLRLALST